MHSNVSLKHSNYVNIVSQSNVVSYEVIVHICLLMDFFQKSRFDIIWDPDRVFRFAPARYLRDNK